MRPPFFTNKTKHLEKVLRDSAGRARKRSSVFLAPLAAHSSTPRPKAQGAGSVRQEKNLAPLLRSLDYRGTHRYASAQRQNGTAALTEPVLVLSASLPAVAQAQAQHVL